MENKNVGKTNKRWNDEENKKLNNFLIEKKQMLLKNLELNLISKSTIYKNYYFFSEMANYIETKNKT